MLCHIVEENYLKERDMFQESVTAHNLKDLALNGVSIAATLGVRTASIFVWVRCEIKWHEGGMLTRNVMLI